MTAFAGDCNVIPFRADLMARKNVEHVITVDPRKEWVSGLGWFLRYRGIFTFFTSKLVSSGLIWNYWNHIVGVSVLFCGIGGAMCLWISRRFILRGMDVDDRLHNFIHGTRDNVAFILSQKKKSVADDAVDRFHQETANRIAAYFRVALKNDFVGCAIRLAESVKGVECYVTYARSTGLEARASHSQPLPADKGVAHALRDKEKRGVWIVNDIKAAIAEHVWCKQANDDSEDVQSVMVVPINSLENGVPAMLGMLYITAREPIFKHRNSSAAKAFADELGLVYPILFAKLDELSTRRKPPGNP